MPSIVITIGGTGRTKTISSGDLTTRLLPALRYLRADPKDTSDQQIIEDWAEGVTCKDQAHGTTNPDQLGQRPEWQS